MIEMKFIYGSEKRDMEEKQDKNFCILEFENNKFDIIGDIHGCFNELIQLVEKLGYQKIGQVYIHPQGRKLISVGDIADKGNQNLEALEFWMNQVAYGNGFCVHGNHCNKLYRYFLGSKVLLTHGIEETVRELNTLSKENRAKFRNRYIQMHESQSFYLLLDKGRLVVVHGGLKKEQVGHFSNKIRNMCLYGEVTGITNKEGKPQRFDWALEYKGTYFIVYGHTVKEEAKIINNTIDIDQGCVYGGYLTAFRYPEKEIIQVKGKAYRIL